VTRPLPTLAALLCVFASTLAPPAIRVARADDAPAVDARERSREAFKRGVSQIHAQDWPGARASFEQAWALFQHPSILLNLGIARLRTGDPVLAEQDLVRFLSEDGGASAEELAGAREALAEARSKIGTLRVLVSPASASVSVDGKPIELLRKGEALVGEARTKPGRHTVTASAEGFVQQQRDVTVAAKGDAEEKITLAAVGAPAGPAEGTGRGTSTRTIVGWSAVGLAGAAVVTGAAFALRAKGLADDYETPGSGGFQDPHTRSVGIGFRTGADVALGVAIVSGAAAVLLLLTDVGSDRTARRDALIRW
jgi:hypothetical protein